MVLWATREKILQVRQETSIFLASFLEVTLESHMTEEKAEATVVTAEPAEGQLPSIIAPGLAGVQEWEADHAVDNWRSRIGEREVCVFSIWHPGRPQDTWGMQRVTFLFCHFMNCLINWGCSGCDKTWCSTVGWREDKEDRVRSQHLLAESYFQEVCWHISEATSHRHYQSHFTNGGKKNRFWRTVHGPRCHSSCWDGAFSAHFP